MKGKKIPSVLQLSIYTVLYYYLTWKYSEGLNYCKIHVRVYLNIPDSQLIPSFFWWRRWMKSLLRKTHASLHVNSWHLLTHMVIYLQEVCLLKLANTGSLLLSFLNTSYKEVFFFLYVNSRFMSSCVMLFCLPPPIPSSLVMCGPRKDTCLEMDLCRFMKERVLLEREKPTSLFFIFE